MELKKVCRGASVEPLVSTLSTLFGELLFQRACDRVRVRVQAKFSEGVGTRYDRFFFFNVGGAACVTGWTQSLPSRHAHASRMYRH